PAGEARGDFPGSCAGGRSADGAAHWGNESAFGTERTGASETGAQRGSSAAQGATDPGERGHRSSGGRSNPNYGGEWGRKRADRAFGDASSACSGASSAG